MKNVNKEQQQVKVNPFLKQLVIALTIYICSFIFTKVKYYKEVLKIITVLILTGKDLIRVLKLKEKKNLSECLLLFCVFTLLALGKFDESALSAIVFKIEEQIFKLWEPKTKSKKKFKTEPSVLNLPKAYSVNVEKESKINKIYQILIVGITVLILIFSLFQEDISTYFYRALLTLTALYTSSIYLKTKNVIEALLKEQIVVINKEKIALLPKIKNYIFEKTKTLTIGEFRVTEVESEDEEELFYYLNYGEYFSNHPIAEAIRNYKKVEVNPRKIRSYKEITNRGIIYQIDNKKTYIGNQYHMKDNGIEFERNLNVGTITYVAVNKTFIGSVVISDGIKYKTKSAIDAIKKLHPKHIAVLSCDNERIVTAISKELKIKDHYSNLTDEEKIFWSRHIKEQHKGITAIIGSEDTNCELYKQGNISICLTSNLDNQTPKADIYLLDSDLTKLLTAIKIVKNTKRQNILYNVGFIMINILIVILILLKSLPLWILLIIRACLKIIEMKGRESND